MKPTRLLAASLLAFALNAPAHAAPLWSTNCHLDVRTIETSSGIFVVAQVDAVWDLLIDADMDLTVNGQHLKSEPVLTSTQQVFVEWIAPRGTTVSACARITGRNWVTEESWLPADTSDCAFASSELTRPNAVSPRLPSGSTLRLPATRSPLPRLRD